MPRSEVPAIALRPLSEADARALLPLWRDRAALRFTYQPCLTTERACLEHVRWLVTRAAQPGGGSHAFCAVLDGRVVGIAGLERREARSREIWYALRRDCWGAGLGTQVVARLVERAFADRATRRVTAEVVVENVPSARVLEKNGLARECVRRGKFEREGKKRDLARYALARPAPSRSPGLAADARPPRVRPARVRPAGGRASAKRPRSTKR